MGKILCYIYEQMADFEVVLLLHKLKNIGKYEIVSVSEDLNLLTAQSGLHYRADMKIEDIADVSEYDALVIPGGPINNEQNAICPIAIQMEEAGKLIGAICFGPQFLGRAGILDRHKFTTSCGAKWLAKHGIPDPYPRENCIWQDLVSDRNLITAQGGAFVEFAQEMCKYLGVKF